MNNVYWTMKNGEKIDIDEMDINHLRNTLKMIVRRAEEVKKDIIKRGLYREIKQFYDEWFNKKYEAT